MARNRDSYGQSSEGQYGRSSYGRESGDSYGYQSDGRGRQASNPYSRQSYGQSQSGSDRYGRYQGQYQGTSQGYGQDGGRYQGQYQGQYQGAGQYQGGYATQGQYRSQGNVGRAQAPISYADAEGQAARQQAARQQAARQQAAQRDYSREAYATGAGYGNGGNGGGYTPEDYDPNREGMTRRRFLIAGASVIGVIAAGGAGLLWWNNRPVDCVVNGSYHKLPVGSSVQNIIDKGYASPRCGNLVSIPDANGASAIIEQGAGESYTVTVNGEPVDIATYRLGPDDDVEFQNGADVVEDYTDEDTPIPCDPSITIPSDGLFLSVIGYVKSWARDGVARVRVGSRSGQRVDMGVVREPTSFEIACGTINPDDGRLLVALTIDDGPDLTYTPQYLDIFARYGVKATFFNLGENLNAGPEYTAMAQRVVAEGHQLASHTYAHRNLLETDSVTRIQDVASSFDAVLNNTNVNTAVLRAPYGNFYGSTYLEYLRAGGKLAYTAYWGVDSSDWEKPGVDQLVANCCGQVASNPAAYNGAVILIHDGGGDRSQDVAALPSIIETYMNAGFQFVTMNEIIKADSSYADKPWVWDGTGNPPEGAYIP